MYRQARKKAKYIHTILRLISGNRTVGSRAAGFGFPHVSAAVFVEEKLLHKKPGTGHAVVKEARAFLIWILAGVLRGRVRG